MLPSVYGYAFISDIALICGYLNMSFFIGSVVAFGSFKIITLIVRKGIK